MMNNMKPVYLMAGKAQKPQNARPFIPGGFKGKRDSRHQA